MSKNELTMEHYKAILSVSNGADILSLYLAKLLREVEKEYPSYIKICKPKGKYKVTDKLPYFGVIATEEGKRVSILKTKGL